MKIFRYIILIAVLVFGVTAFAGAAGITAQAARAENAEQRVYTPYELGCMAQYYYKRTSEKGYYPPGVSCEEQKDGTYAVTLFEKFEEDAAVSSTTYAQYVLNSNASGIDSASGKEIDLTFYSKVYTPEELCKLAQNYYYTTNDFYPPNAEATANKDGTYTICLYDTIDDAEGTEHSSTCGWLTVNVCGVGRDDLTMQSVDINP